jgi:hypothetical protein
MDRRKLILERLLRKYEDSAHSRGDAETGRRVILRFGPRSTDVKEYVVEDYDGREAFHEAVKELAAQGLVGCEWERDSDRGVLSRVWLVLESVDSAYALAGLNPRAQAVEKVLRRLADALGELGEGSASWVREALQDVSVRVARNHKLSPTLPEEPELAGAVIDALRALARPDFVEVSQRIFSVRVYRDSKTFERQVRSRLLPILRRYGPWKDSTDEEERPDDDVLLAQAGLFKNPEVLEFRGPVRLRFEGGETDCGPLVRGATLSSAMVPILLSIDTSRVSSVMFIENRTNYEDRIQQTNRESKHVTERDGELVVYHGGFLSRRRAQFFRILAESLPKDCLIAHWGDIDLGGLHILLELRKVVGLREVRAWRMDRRTLLENRPHAISFGDAYRKRLEKALESPGFCSDVEAADVVRCMLESGLRLEQEALVGKV